MVILKTAREIDTLKKAGQISAAALRIGGSMLRDGISTAAVDDAMRDFIREQGAEPSFLGYSGYPKSINISINDEVIHGIPSPHRLIRDGDLVSIDVGACYHGYHGDNAATFAVGSVSDRARCLMEVTRESLKRAVAVAVKGNRLGDIGFAVQSWVEHNGFSVIRDFVGHGIGRELHEEPEVRNYGRAGYGIRLVPGMVIAIEPMVAEHGYEVKILDDGWTVVTKDGGLAAHFEYTIAVTDGSPMILTAEQER